MIKKIQIIGFKSIKSCEIDLRPINILIGGNGVGKSNFIAVFSLVKAIYNANLSEYVIKKGGANGLLHFGKKVTQEIFVNFNFDDINKFMVTLGEAQDALYIKSTDTAFLSGIWHYQNHEKNKKESGFRDDNIGQAFYVSPRLKEFEIYHFHDTSDHSPIKGFSNVSDNHFLRKDGSNIAAFLFHLKEKHPKHFFRIEKTIQSIAPFFKEFVLQPANDNERLIKLEWKEKGGEDFYADAYSLSDGTLRFICLTTLLMQPNLPHTIIIDEPELGLHPVAINKLAGLIRKVSHTSQVIVSTQSTNFIDNFEAEDIIVADRKNNETVLRRLDAEELAGWLEDYSIGEVWEKNTIGGQPFSD